LFSPITGKLQGLRCYYLKSASKKFAYSKNIIREQKNEIWRKRGETSIVSDKIIVKNRVLFHAKAIICVEQFL